MTPSAEERCRAFRALHASGCFVVANAWDRGSARFLAQLGFPALATTSAGLALANGRPDTPAALGLETTLRNAEAIASAVDVPVTVDLQDGHGATPEAVGESVRAFLALPIAGISIEDATGGSTPTLRPIPEAAAYVRAARAAIDSSGRTIVLTARAECFLVGSPDPLDDAIRRLGAYVEAGADCIYAPGLRTAAQVRALADALSPAPLNVLAAGFEGATVASLAACGARRISVGSALARVARSAFAAAAREISATASFRVLRDTASFAELDPCFPSP